MNVNDLTESEKSVLLYVEYCSTFHSGLISRESLYGDRLGTLGNLMEKGLLTYGQIPPAILEAHEQNFHRPFTHYVTLSEAGWDMAQVIRRLRAEDKSLVRQWVDEFLRGGE